MIPTFPFFTATTESECEPSPTDSEILRSRVNDLVGSEIYRLRMENEFLRSWSLGEVKVKAAGA